MTEHMKKEMAEIRRLKKLVELFERLNFLMKGTFSDNAIQKANQKKAA